MSIATNTLAGEAEPRSTRENRSGPSRPDRARKAGRPGLHSGSRPVDSGRNLFRTVLFLISGVSAFVAVGLSAMAGGAQIVVIPANDGYGLSDCLTAGSACGPIVANAVCKAHGLAASKAFGPAEPEVGTTHAALPADGEPAPIAVTCGD